MVIILLSGCYLNALPIPPQHQISFSKGKLDMNRLVIVIATAIVIVIAGSIILIDILTKGPDDKTTTTHVETENDKEDTTTDAESEEGRSTEENTTNGAEPRPSETVSVSINAIPWARVFIRLPENDYFMEPRARDFTIPPEPNQKDSNVTPIPGDLKVPTGTAIKLMYRGKEKVFPYEKWKDGKTISYDFLNQ